MNKTLCELHQLSAARAIKLLEALKPEEWLIQPDGFPNNIAWNVGHMLLVRQNLIYRNAGLDTGLDDTMGPMYAPGSSPADWESEPDPTALLNQFKAVTAKLTADVEAGLFNDISFNSFTLGEYMSIDTIDASAGFNLYHEGIHTGNINDLQDVIRHG